MKILDDSLGTRKVFSNRWLSCFSNAHFEKSVSAAVSPSQSCFGDPNSLAAVLQMPPRIQDTLHDVGNMPSSGLVTKI